MTLVLQVLFQNSHIKTYNKGSKPTAGQVACCVQPVVMWTANWAGKGRKGSKNEIGKKKGIDCNHS